MSSQSQLFCTDSALDPRSASRSLGEECRNCHDKWQLQEQLLTTLQVSQFNDVTFLKRENVGIITQVQDSGLRPCWNNSVSPIGQYAGNTHKTSQLAGGLLETGRPMPTAERVRKRNEQKCQANNIVKKMAK